MTLAWNLSPLFLLPGEDQARLNELAARLQLDIQAEGAREEHYVLRLAGIAWRLARIYQLEREYYLSILKEHPKTDGPFSKPEKHTYAQAHPFPASLMASLRHRTYDTLTTLHRLQRDLEEAWDRALDQLHKQQLRRIALPHRLNSGPNTHAHPKAGSRPGAPNNSNPAPIT